MGCLQESGGCMIRAKELAREVAIVWGPSEAKPHRALVNSMERAQTEHKEHNRVESACQAASLVGCVRTELKTLLGSYAQPQPLGSHCRSPASLSRSGSARGRNPPQAATEPRQVSRYTKRSPSPVGIFHRPLQCGRPSRRLHYWAMRDVDDDNLGEPYACCEGMDAGYGGWSSPRTPRKGTVPPNEHFKCRVAGSPDEQVIA